MRACGVGWGGASIGAAVPRSIFRPRQIHQRDPIHPLHAHRLAVIWGANKGHVPGRWILGMDMGGGGPDGGMSMESFAPWATVRILSGRTRLLCFMPTPFKPLLAGLVLATGSFALPSAAVAAATPLTVRLERVPAGGLQPQAAVDAAGRTHLVWLEGEAKAADVRYAWRDPATTAWSTPLRVNTTPGSALAVGTIRGPQLALGRAGRVHVCWNGSSEARPKPELGGAPLLYTRINASGMGFEPERNLMGHTRHLDGGAAVAADAEGRVFVVWHAAPATDPAVEMRRSVYLAASSDDGPTFASERIVSPTGSGACGCCGLQAHAGPGGTLAILYRGASAVDQRPATLLASHDHGATFSVLLREPWNVGQCPMSSASLHLTDSSTVLAAWGLGGQVHWQRVAWTDAVQPPAARPQVVTADRSTKHPVVAVNGRGETLIAWTSGTGWQRGGSLAWQVVDARNAVLREGRSDGVPVWGSLAAVAEPDGTFVVWY